MHAIADDVRPVSRLFRALGDETRLRVIALLAHGELCVCHLQEALELPQPTVSRQLAILRRAGLVEDRRERTWVYYRLRRQENSECERQLRRLADGFAKDACLRRTVEKLVKTCGPGACK
jgi:ArsR family transcriptional regulator